MVIESKVPWLESRREAEVSFSPSLPPFLPLSLLLLFAGLHFVAMETGSKRLSREGRLGGDISPGKPSCAPARLALCFTVCQQTSPKKTPTITPQSIFEEGHSSPPNSLSDKPHGNCEFLMAGWRPWHSQRNPAWTRLRCCKVCWGIDKPFSLSVP